MNTIHTDRSDPLVDRIIRSAFPSYSGRKVQLVPSETVELSDTAWSGGSRSSYAGVSADGGDARPLPQLDPAEFGGPSRPPVVDPEVWHIPLEFFSIDDLPDTLTAFLKLLSENFVPEIRATIDLYHQWLDAEDRSAGAIADVEGKKRCHQVLGEVEHVQAGVPIKRIGLLDDISHHVRFQALVDHMSDSEKQALTGVLESVGAGDLVDLRLKREVKRDDYAFVLV